MSELHLLKEHREWIGLIQPIGLVVSPSALTNAQLRIQKDVFDLQDTFRSITDESGLLPLHLPSLFTRVLGWRTDDLSSGEMVRNLDVFLPEREAYLKADYAVKNAESSEVDILIKYIDQFHFVEEEVPEGRGWQASPHSKFERHLREKNLSIGILINRFGLRLIYSPKGETSGYLTFPFAFMRETQGRPVLAALHLLLCEDRLFKGDKKQRLHNLLIESRKFQNEVSTKLSEQVLAALYELVRGLQEADEETKGKLLEEVLKRDKNEVYHSLLTVLLRTVFTLYAEDRDLLSSDPVFLNNYSINGLFAKLREDASKHYDSMNLRYGAWAHLLSLFRLIYEGIELETDSIPGRKGHLFDPDRFPFLEGRAKPEDSFKPPRISDGVVWRVLSNLMTLDGERISYRALDVEQIGSVYETVMGFQLEIANGPSIAIKPAKAHGAPVVVNLIDVLGSPAAKRAAKLKELTDNKFDGRIGDAVKAANSYEELVSALGSRVAEWATPTIVRTGAMILQPSDARRRSGSHYTPRSLTAPIVERALEPILFQLGDNPKPEEILALKICDPAMGSGAFLVEACRQLSEILVKSWAIHRPNIRIEIPPDEDELLYARRMIAQRCLYGVDKNPMAVNLAKLSLWLATFAKQHEFTFLDHCLKCGDSLVGLGISQILAVTWDSGPNPSLPHASIADRLNRVREVRSQISNAADGASIVDLENLKFEEDSLLNDLRCIGDAVIYTFLKKDKPRERQEELTRIHLMIETWFASGLSFANFRGLDNELKWLRIEKSLIPFHWECEFPEVFRNPTDSSSFGFDVFIGNPPFAGKNTIIGNSPTGYLKWLSQIHPGSHGNADLVAHFFRRCFNLLRSGGTFGLIATNTISQGDTRSTGLTQILASGGEIFSAIKRVKWPGQAAVVVSVVHIGKDIQVVGKTLEGRIVPNITAFLFDTGPSSDPHTLLRNRNKSYQGSIILGMGFTFDDNNRDGISTPIEDMNRLIQVDPRNGDRIKPYIGGEEINSSPTHSPHRFVIDFDDYPEATAKTWPALYDILEQKVKPERLTNNDIQAREKWWLFLRRRSELYREVSTLTQFIVLSRVGRALAFTFIPPRAIIADSVVAVVSERFADFAILQSRIHEVWARFMGSSMKDDLRYTPTDCFETFPFPIHHHGNGELEEIGRQYFEYRRNLMTENNEGMTKTYNRFHDSSERSELFVRLRELHGEMDMVVLKAYGWTDLTPATEYLADYDDEDGGASYRLRWPDSLRDQILGRLMDLNAQYASEEAVQGEEE